MNSYEVECAKNICIVIQQAPIATPQWEQIVLGAGIAISSTFIAQKFKLFSEKKQEIEYAKVSLIDEITEIFAIIERMCEVYRTTKSIPRTYFNDLLENKTAFTQHKPRLFIISDAGIRKAIGDFYKKLDVQVKKADSIVGDLNDPNPEATNSKVVEEFEKIKSEAAALAECIKKYKH